MQVIACMDISLYVWTDAYMHGWKNGCMYTMAATRGVTKGCSIIRPPAAQKIEPSLTWKTKV